VWLDGSSEEAEDSRFSHVPPPHHGQSVMVQIMLEGVRADPRVEAHHVDARASDDL